MNPPIYLIPKQTESRWMVYLSPIIAFVLTLLAASILLVSLGHSAPSALYAFFIQPLTDTYGWTELGLKMTPLLLCAAGLTLCFKANIWNIGAEGQMIMGMLGGGVIALQLSDAEGFWVLPLVLFFGVLCGIAWSSIALLLKNHFEVNEILTTIMLNYIAINLFLYGVHGPLKDPDGMNFAQSAMFPDAAMLPNLFKEEYRLNAAFLLGLLALVIVWVIFSRTWVGFQLRVVGEDPKAARYAGYKIKWLTAFALLLSGALAGLAGITEALGASGQLTPSLTTTGYGYTAIIVAFLGRLNPIGILLASALLALTFLGGENLQIEMQLPQSITALFQGMLLFFLLACDIFISYTIKWRGK